MKLRSKKLKRATSMALIFAISSLLLVPAFAFANVQVTEIMYDAPGADTGHEWVEVTNTGQENIDIGKYKLFENGTNHGLAIVSGSSALSPNASAILADDPAKFLVDYPSYSGTLLNTAFSLSNTGESLALKDASSTIVDSVSYASIADASGTGGSLHKSGASFVAAMANPGVYPGTLSPVPQKQKTTAPSLAKKTIAASPAKNTGGSSVAASAAPKFDSNSASPASAADFISLIPPSTLWLLGLVAVILLGVAGVIFVRLGKKETCVTAGEFKIE